MKKVKQTNVQYIVIPLLAVYLVIALAHIAFMPNLNAVAKSHSPASTELLHKNNNPGNSGTAYQRGIRSVVENKRKTLIPSVPAFTMFFAFIISGLLLIALTKKPGSIINPSGVLHPKAYLELHTFRI